MGPDGRGTNRAPSLPHARRFVHVNQQVAHGVHARPSVAIEHLYVVLLGVSAMDLLRRSHLISAPRTPAREAPPDTSWDARAPHDCRRFRSICWQEDRERPFDSFATTFDLATEGMLARPWQRRPHSVRDRSITRAEHSRSTRCGHSPSTHRTSPQPFKAYRLLSRTGHVDQPSM
jgi:hypothetical protein